MASYNLSTSTAEETALTAIVSKRNTERAAQSPPLGAITNSQYVAALWNGILRDYVQQTDDETNVNPVRDAFKTANTATRNQVKALLGL